MKKIVCVLSVLVLIGTGCDINQLEFSNLKTPKPAGLVALPLGHMTWSMEDLMAEVTAVDYELDEFNGIVLNYNETVDAAFPVSGSVPVDIVDTIPIASIDIPLDFFSRFSSGGIRFQSPEVNFAFTNTINAPLLLDFSGSYAIREDTASGVQTRIDLTGDVIDSPTLIRSPSNPGEAETSTVIIHRNNSNIQDLFNISPTLIHIEISVIVQLSTAVTIADNASLNADINVKLPLALIFEDFEIPLEFDLGGGVEFDYADSLALHIVTGNMLPFTVLLTFQILGEEGDTLYEVYREQIIAPPFLDTNFEAHEMKAHVSDIPLSSAGIAALNSGSRIRTVLKLDTSKTLTSTEIYVRILINYLLQIELGIVGKLNPDSGLF
ncbi:MAG: hypothetical protein JXQ90_11870 [Cyclobacteriaceae bacterium]